MRSNRLGFWPLELLAGGDLFFAVVPALQVIQGREFLSRAISATLTSAGASRLRLRKQQKRDSCHEGGSNYTARKDHSYRPIKTKTSPKTKLIIQSSSTPVLWQTDYNHT